MKSRSAAGPPWFRSLLATVMLGTAALQIARPMVSYRALAVGANAQEVGLIAAAYALLPALVAVPLGRVARRHRLLTFVVVGLLILAAAIVLLSQVNSVIALYLPVVGEHAGVSPAAVGLLLSLRATASTIARIFVSRAVAWVGRIQLLALSAAISGACLGTLPAGASVPTLALPLLVAGTFLGMGQPLTMTWMVSIAPKGARSRALALRIAGNRSGQVVGPTAAGILAGFADVGAVFWALSVMLMGVATATFIYRRNPADYR